MSGTPCRGSISFWGGSNWGIASATGTWAWLLLAASTGAACPWIPSSTICTAGSSWASTTGAAWPWMMTSCTLAGASSSIIATWNAAAPGPSIIAATATGSCGAYSPWLWWTIGLLSLKAIS